MTQPGESAACQKGLWWLRLADDNSARLDGRSESGVSTLRCCHRASTSTTRSNPETDPERRGLPLPVFSFRRRGAL